jgi:hypothetical protein
MTARTGSDESFSRLHAAGWTVGDVAVHGESGAVWVVTGTNGENCIEARGASQDEAWRNAVLQAEAVGMAGQFLPDARRRYVGHDFSH